MNWMKGFTQRTPDGTRDGTPHGTIVQRTANTHPAQFRPSRLARSAPPTGGWTEGVAGGESDSSKLGQPLALGGMAGESQTATSHFEPVAFEGTPPVPESAMSREAAEEMTG